MAFALLACKEHLASPPGDLCFLCPALLLPLFHAERLMPSAAPPDDASDSVGVLSAYELTSRAALRCALPLAEAGLHPALELWVLNPASDTESDRRLIAAIPHGITTTGGACTGSSM